MSLRLPALPRIITSVASGRRVTSPAEPDLPRPVCHIILRYISSEARLASSVSIGSVEDSLEEAGRD